MNENKLKRGGAGTTLTGPGLGGRSGSAALDTVTVTQAGVCESELSADVGSGRCAGSTSMANWAQGFPSEEWSPGQTFRSG